MGRLRAEPAFKRARKRAGLSDWTFRDLRHFFVTELFRSGASAPAIQQLAGHAELTTTQLYADLDANDLRSAIERIDGGSAPVARHGGGLGDGGGL
jgi:site-specific recombinase XerD